MKLSRLIIGLAVALTASNAFGAAKYNDYFQEIFVNGAQSGSDMLTTGGDPDSSPSGTTTDLNGGPGSWDSLSANDGSGGATTTAFGNFTTGIGNGQGTYTNVTAGGTGTDVIVASINIENFVQTWWKGQIPPPINGFTAIDVALTFTNNGGFGDAPVTLSAQWGGNPVAGFGGTTAPFAAGFLVTQRIWLDEIYTGNSTDGGVKTIDFLVAGNGVDDFSFTLGSVSLTSNPEPASIGLLTGVFAAFGGVFFRRRRSLTDTAA